MADATVRKLFNQAVLPSHSQGETLHRQMKEKDCQPHSHTLIADTDTHEHRPLILLISQGVTLHF